MTEILDAGATLEYAVVDVFVGDPPQPFQGNPLAVVLGGDALSTEQCQALAVEFHLSETAFPMSPTVAGADYRSRIFTITSELPFAGHPSVGGAWVLARLGTIAAGRAVQECGVGLVALEVPGDASEPVTLTGPVPEVSGPVDAAPLLAAVGLDPDDLAGVPRLSGTGIAFAYLPVRADALARVQADLDALGGLADVTGVFVFALAAGQGGRLAVRARMLAADIGGEDPATGSAAHRAGGVAGGLGSGRAGR